MIDYEKIDLLPDQQETCIIRDKCDKCGETIEPFDRMYLNRETFKIRCFPYCLEKEPTDGK
jgi:formylmethanofuran dehydrogenase subunit E